MFAGSSVWSAVGPTNGVYLQIGNRVRFLGASVFNLKGRRQYLDIGLHLPAADDPGHTKEIQLHNTTPSQLIGAVYAPNSTLRLQGNRSSGFARLTRGGLVGQRGGAGRGLADRTVRRCPLSRQSLPNRRLPAGGERLRPRAGPGASQAGWAIGGRGRSAHRRPHRAGKCHRGVTERERRVHGRPRRRSRARRKFSTAGK